jgi:SecD/SecF fusion protein
MSRNDLWKWLALVILLVLSAYVALPPSEKIKKGLDLSGGTSFTIAINEESLADTIRAGSSNELTEAAIKEEMATILKDADARAIEVIRNRVDRLGVAEPVIHGGKDHRIFIQLPGATPEQRAAAEKSIQDAAYLEFKLVHPRNAELVDKVFASKRVPEGYVLGDDGRSFKQAPNYNTIIKQPGYAARLARFEMPEPRYTFMLEPRGTGINRVYEPIFVARKPELTGSALSSASVERDSMTGRLHISLTFNAKGAMEFAKVTRKYKPRGTQNNSEIGRRLAIILDGTLYSAPTIESEIPDGRAVINGSFTPSEANLLSNILKAGSLPAPMKIIEVRDVGSTLGQDAINSGVNASIAGVVLVALFMLIYYAYCGIVANIALLLNFVLLPAGLIFVSNVLGAFGGGAGGVKDPFALPVLTMPGIAGIVLTLGMAVDANVLIFERMREEFAQGKSARAAIAAGYDRAFLAIFDSNITTLLTAAILFIFGAGPIRGYAVTLSAGVVISMFTALIVTRLIFNATVPENRVKPYWMMRLIKPTNIDFLKYGKICGIASIIVIVSSCAIFMYRAWTKPASVMSVDFTGGAAMTYSYVSEPDMGVVRSTVNNIFGDATIQYQSAPDNSSKLLLVKTGLIQKDGKNSSAIVQEALSAALPQCKFTLASEDAVGPAVGKDLKNAAYLAIFFSLIGIFIYVALRFETGFAVGALVALAHDAFFMIGVYSLTGRQMSLTIVAAILTIVGYSINDTIVIFDRIREDLRKDLKMDFRSLVNRSINSTLSRTVLTSTTVLLSTLSLYIFGGGAINDFALAMLIGLVVGTYSTVFIAAPVMLLCYKGRRPAFASSDSKK